MLQTGGKNLVFIFFSILTCKAGAMMGHEIINSSPTKKPWKLSQEQYLIQFGKYDTSRAIINYYFAQGNVNGQKKVIVNSIISAVGIISFALISTNGSFGTIIIGTPFLAAGLLFGVFAFKNAINMIYFSRKKLYHVLQKYLGDKGIPVSLRRDIFKKKDLNKE